MNILLLPSAFTASLAHDISGPLGHALTLLQAVLASAALTAPAGYTPQLLQAQICLLHSGDRK
jgi:hypothetical protein